MGGTLLTLGREAAPSAKGDVERPTADEVTILTTFGPLATKVLGPGPDGLVTVLEGLWAGRALPRHHSDRARPRRAAGPARALGRLPAVAADPRRAPARGGPAALQAAAARQ